MLIRFLTGFILLLNCVMVMAQDMSEASDEDKDRMYVTDQLRLSLYAEANSQSEVVRLLQSGDLLLIQELRGPYALVTTSDGTRGWVKRGFLVANPTANLLLIEEQSLNNQLTAEIEKLGNSKLIIEQYEADMDLLVEQKEALENERQVATETIASLQQELEARQAEIDRKGVVEPHISILLWQVLRQHWQIILPVVLAILLLCFIISKQIVETRIKNKFHGIKIW